MDTGKERNLRYLERLRDEFAIAVCSNCCFDRGDAAQQQELADNIWCIVDMVMSRRTPGGAEQDNGN